MRHELIGVGCGYGVMLWRCTPTLRARLQHHFHVSPGQPHGVCHAASCFARRSRATDGGCRIVVG